LRPPLFDTISFLSDYGLEDEFVGVVKSVVRSIAPQVTVIDITHAIAPYDVRGGALALVRAVQYLAPGVVLAVVDPGVGTERRAVAVEVADGEAYFVGPDNGVLAAAVSMTGGATRAVSLTNREHHLPAPGPTFAGRDILAPAAALLCNGVDLAELGEDVDPLSLVPGIVPLPREEEHEVLAEVLWVDRFGNAQLNLGPEELERFGDALLLRWRDESRVVQFAPTYADLPTGRAGLVVDSYGMVSIAHERGSAAEELRLATGDGVSISMAPA
jgi:S-adenosylmethionine hydrolase